MKPELLDAQREIGTARLRLRCYQAGEGQHFFDLMRRNRDHFADAVPEEWLNFASATDAENTVRAMIADWHLRRSFFFSMWHTATGDYLGHIPLFAPDWTVSRIEIGYILDLAYQGQGLMTEGARACLKFAFDELEVNKVVLHCFADNARSYRLAERLGFALDGEPRAHAVKRDGSMVGWLAYGLTRASYEQNG